MKTVVEMSKINGWRLRQRIGTEKLEKEGVSAKSFRRLYKVDKKNEKQNKTK